MEDNKKLIDNNSGVESDEYFKSITHRYVFALAELDGESREKILGISRVLYNDKVKAKAWRDAIVKLIHPDVCTIKGADRAMAKLNELYSRMVADDE